MRRRLLAGTTLAFLYWFSPAFEEAPSKKPNEAVAHEIQAAEREREREAERVRRAEEKAEERSMRGKALAAILSFVSAQSDEDEQTDER